MLRSGRKLINGIRKKIPNFLHGQDEFVDWKPLQTGLGVSNQAFRRFHRSPQGAGLDDRLAKPGQLVGTAA